MTDLTNKREQWQRYSGLGGYLPAEESIIEQADIIIDALEEEIAKLNIRCGNLHSKLEDAWRAP